MTRINQHKCFVNHSPKLAEAIAANNQGHFAQAELHYGEILADDPLHPDANHNLGLLEVKKFNTAKAVTLFETSLKHHPHVPRFWISYIDALIRLDKLQDAKENIDRANQRGFPPERFSVFEQRLRLPKELGRRNEFFKANEVRYLDFLEHLHRKRYNRYFEIGTRAGDSIKLSRSPSVAIDPFLQVDSDVIGEKDSCLFFQTKSDDFFEQEFPNFRELTCELGFIDGLHLFEYALKDFINLAKISAEKSLLIFHDPMPWSFEMTRRDYLGRPKGAWTGDVWKLVPILLDAGLKDSMSLIPSAPSGLLAVMNPDQTKVLELHNNFAKIVADWTDVTLEIYGLKKFYECGSDIFVKPEAFFAKDALVDIGASIDQAPRGWVSP